MHPGETRNIYFVLLFMSEIIISLLDIYMAIIYLYSFLTLAPHLSC